ncbi:phosphoglycerate mutase [Microbispora rosea subsp. aerata]|nr:histidine phosphatase family protein [Microbispora rosea]GGO13664.1 phosphoglycerate mutase [Microbispora rosea subsp. aerata]GIH53969.1 phosphoglycerate mutase [Microbispora rosea subsp. aerata]GLJ84942.1 phosphoglycerate mutase [Microbispora rosea subsp. aerata]
MIARTLVVVRHATAGDAPGLPDRERPLTPGGERDARAAGEEIKRLTPGLVLCSPSVRTRRTAELLGLDAPVEVERDIYEAYPDDLLGVLRRTDGEITSVVLVGHNPGVHELVATLTDARLEGFPPAAYAVIELDVPWEDIAPGTGRLIHMSRP